jgi:exopolyphosphatase/guanosine-5'-triphosphate,3'-diphosphate pyrophosphatase
VSGSGGGPIAAALDVGSNSVLLLVVAVGPDGRTRAVDEASATTRLGAGLRAGGLLDAAAAARTLAAVVALAACARAAGAANVWAFATGAARGASDGAEFAAATASAAGIPLEVLSGDREARLAYAAAIHGLGLGDGPVLVIDVGGATTELTLGRGASVAGATSLGVGALALAEVCRADVARMRAEVAAALGTTDLPARAREAGASAIASGGTATSLAALALGLATYDPRRVHGAILSAEAAVAGTRAADAARGPIDPGRAAILPAGACILSAVMTALGVERVQVSDHGVRHAYLRERLLELGLAADMSTLWS